MTEAPAASSKRALKKQAREAAGQGQSSTRSDSVHSDTAKKSHNGGTTPLESDADFKLRDGANPFIDVVQKKIRNLTKRKARLEALEAQKNDSSMPPLKPDQIEALSHLPSVIAVITELNEFVGIFKKIEQSENELVLSQHRKYKEDLRALERVKEDAVKEAYEKGLIEGRTETKILTSFLKYASHLRGMPSHIEAENSAAEAVLIGVYQGGDKGAEVAQKLAEGADEVVGDDPNFTYGRVKEAALKLEDPTRDEFEDAPSAQLNGSYEYVNHETEHTNGTAGYQIPLSETSALDSETYIHTHEASHQIPGEHPTELNFFQSSELETEHAPQSISFLQESEIGTSQPHEDYTGDEPQESIDVGLPPVQTLTEPEGPPKVNLGITTFAGTGTSDSGNAAAEQILSKTNTPQPVEPKTDWAEEASPTTESAPLFPEKKKEEEWTTQGSRHSRHQSQQQRGGRGGGRGGRGEGWRGGEGRGSWRGGEGRGGERGGHRGGRGGERGVFNGEKRGSYRGGERGRGRGGNSLPPTAV